jgi:hypothetical protein
MKGLMLAIAVTLGVLSVAAWWYTPPGEGRQDFSRETADERYLLEFPETVQHFEVRLAAMPGG